MLKPYSCSSFSSVQLCRDLLKNRLLLSQSASAPMQLQLIVSPQCRFCSSRRRNTETTPAASSNNNRVKSSTIATSSHVDAGVTVRTRFAPSPTGLIHLGGLRTALYNYLFAKKHGGSFVLRIEDTDRTRLHDKSLASIWHALRYCSLLPDEGPLGECGEEERGDFGPYTQSKRLAIYGHYAEKLLQEGKAYRCFCSNHRLTMLKQAAYQHGQTPRYDGRCRHLGEQEVRERLARREPHTLRLKLPPQQGTGQSGQQDGTTGEGEETTTTIDEGDFIIVKSDTFPTYHFANVVDDHLMNITHVLRGAEWIPAVGRHLFLYRQLGFSPPVIKHLPLIANENGQKLSKRDHNSIFVSNFIHTGYAPEVLLNYITQSGGGFRFPDSEAESRVLSLAEMCESFDIDAIRSNAAILDLNKLKAVSRQFLRQQWQQSESGKQKIITQLKHALAEYNLDEAIVDDSVLERILEHRIRDVKSVKDLVVSPETRFLWAWEPPLETSFGGLQNKNKMIDYAIQQIHSCTDPLHVEQVTAVLSEKDAPFPRNKVLSAMRLCLSIHYAGPRVVDMVMMLGKRETLRRLQESVDSLRQTRDQVVRETTRLLQQKQVKKEEEERAESSKSTS